MNGLFFFYLYPALPSSAHKLLPLPIRLEIRNVFVLHAVSIAYSLSKHVHYSFLFAFPL